MKTVLMMAVLSGSLVISLWAQEKKEMPMEGEGIKAGEMMTERIKGMQARVAEMRRQMEELMKGEKMVRAQKMKGMTKLMGDMSGMMRDMGQMMGSGKMEPEEMRGMSKMMNDMSAMMKRVSEEGMGPGMEKATEGRRTVGERRFDRKDSPRKDTDVPSDRRDFPRKDTDTPSDRRDSPRRDTDMPLEKKDSPVR